MKTQRVYNYSEAAELIYYIDQTLPGKNFTAGQLSVASKQHANLKQVLLSFSGVEDGWTKNSIAATLRHIKGKTFGGRQIVDSGEKLNQGILYKVEIIDEGNHWTPEYKVSSNQTSTHQQTGILHTKLKASQLNGVFKVLRMIIETIPQINYATIEKLEEIKAEITKQAKEDA